MVMAFLIPSAQEIKMLSSVLFDLPSLAESGRHHRHKPISFCNAATNPRLCLVLHLQWLPPVRVILSQSASVLVRTSNQFLPSSLLSSSDFPGSAGEALW